MKKLLLTLVAVGAASSVMAQGTLNYSIRVTGDIVGHVYKPEVADPYASKSGNTASETPIGTQTYSGGFLTGSGFLAQLFAASGPGQVEGSLSVVPGSITSFRTGSTLGGTIAPYTLAIPQVPAFGTGTFQIRVWDNSSGLYANWAAAEAAWLGGAIAAGRSGLFNVANLSDGLAITPNLSGFRSFNIYSVPVPEPSTFVLAGLGAAGLLIFRRRQ